MMGIKDLVATLQRLAPVWKDRSPEQTPFDEQCITQLIKSGLAEARIDVIISRQQDGERVQLNRMVYVASGHNWPHNLSVTAGQDSQMTVEDTRVFGTGIYQYRLTAAGQSALRDIETTSDGFVANYRFQIVAPFQIERFSWDYIQGTLPKPTTPTPPKESYSPWIESREMIAVMKMNGIPSVKDHTIRRRKRDWGAESQPKSNHQLFRFKLSRLQELKIKYPESWDD
jgi:hypothetical protein